MRNLQPSRNAINLDFLNPLEHKEVKTMLTEFVSALVPAVEVAIVVLVAWGVVEGLKRLLSK